MILEEKDNTVEQKYRVMAVEKTLPPDGMTGDWYHYVIGEGNSRIDGKKGGSNWSEQVQDPGRRSSRLRQRRGEHAGGADAVV